MHKSILKMGYSEDLPPFTSVSPVHFLKIIIPRIFYNFYNFTVIHT